MKVSIIGRTLGMVAMLSLGHKSLATGAWVYQNDFVTRKWAGTNVGVWHETSYVPGPIAASCGDLSGAPNPTAPWADPSAMQDNWVKLTGSGNSQGLSFYDSREGDNQCLRIRCTSSESQSASASIAHNLYNAISDGELRFYVSLYIPREWGNGGAIKLRPLFEKGIDPANGGADFGCITSVGAEGLGLWALSCWDNGGLTSARNQQLLDSVEAGRWYQFEITMEFGRSKTHVAIWNDQNELICYQGEIDFYRHATVERGPVTGFAISVSGVKYDESGDLTLQPGVDGISCLWKAPGASEFVSLYENNFTTRRVRCIAPTATTYAYTSGDDDGRVDLFSYSAGQHLIPDLGGDSSILSPIGCDGWKRLNPYGDGFAIIHNDGPQSIGDLKTYGWYLSLSSKSNGDRFVGCGQALPQRITSGKVKISADIKTAKEWTWFGYKAYLLGLGNDAQYNSVGEGCFAGRAYLGGIEGSGSGEAESVFYPVASGSSDTSKRLKGRHWYRVELTVDMDAKKGSCSIYDIGLNAPALDVEPFEKTLVFSAENGDLANDVDEISSFSIFSYAMWGDQWFDDHSAVDNIKVWRDVGTATERLIYANDFMTCRRVYDKRDNLVGGIDKWSPDNDNWVRRGLGANPLWRLTGENPCIAAGGTDRNGVLAVHPIGSVLPRREYAFRVDVRPPAYWEACDERKATCLVGDVKFEQGLVSGEDRFMDHVQVAFGFGDATGENVHGRYSSVRPFYKTVRDGTLVDVFQDIAVDPSHWYRFEAKMRIREGEYDLTVYDMGEAQPASGSANGSAVMSIERLPFCAMPTDGISAIGVSAFGNALSQPWSADDPCLVLFDNLVIEKLRKGFTLSVR